MDATMTLVWSELSYLRTDFTGRILCYSCEYSDLEQAGFPLIQKCLTLVQYDRILALGPWDYSISLELLRTLKCISGIQS
jgi:hypothetical protein